LLVVGQVDREAILPAVLVVVALVAIGQMSLGKIQVAAIALNRLLPSLYLQATASRLAQVALIFSHDKVRTQPSAL
jgi:hypothetical protein